MLSEKYGRTYHYPFSPGTTSDDRINHTYWEDIQQIETPDTHRKSWTEKIIV